MRWAIVRHDGKVRACVPESAAIFAAVVDPAQPLNKIPALLPSPGVVIPLSGTPGVALSWEDAPVPLDGQPAFGEESGRVAVGTGLHIFGNGKG